MLRGRANRPAMIDLTLTVIGNYEKDAPRTRDKDATANPRPPSRARTESFASVPVRHTGSAVSFLRAGVLKVRRGPYACESPRNAKACAL